MKKLISLFLCLCLMAGIVPVTVSSAESSDYPIEQMTLVSELLKDILEAAEKANEKEAGVNAAGITSTRYWNLRVTRCRLPGPRYPA